MRFRRLIQLAVAGALLAGAARGEENLWPFFVGRHDPASAAESDQFVGPLFFHQVDATGDNTAAGLRPVYLETRNGEKHESSFLYPFFIWRRQPDYSYFTFFHLLEHRTGTGDLARHNEQFDVWPFYFSRRSADPEKSYHALFPIGGTLKNRLSRDRIDFVLFPLYMQTEKKGRRVTHTPWPFIRNYAGPGYSGFEFWPLFGRNQHEGDYDHRFYLWPFGLKSIDHLAAPEPDVTVAVLPFYQRSTGPGFRTESYLWPFFGYLDRTKPYTYHETRYFWPLLVQGRGTDRVRNRWAPFYSHSNIKGTDKTWVMWPAYRHLSWEDRGLRHDRDQFLFFVYSSLVQHSLTNPSAAPARKVHVWPLLSFWDNGAGRVQAQALSPLEVLFPHNDKIRQLWTPLFALYQYDRQPDATVRHAFLWNAVTWRRGPAGREFHLGPLFESATGTPRDRWSIGSGLFGFKRTAGDRWRPFLFDFRMKSANKAESAASP